MLSFASMPFWNLSGTVLNKRWEKQRTVREASLLKWIFYFIFFFGADNAFQSNLWLYSDANPSFSVGLSRLSPILIIFILIVFLPYYSCFQWFDRIHLPPRGSDFVCPRVPLEKTFLRGHRIIILITFMQRVKWHETISSQVFRTLLLTSLHFRSLF